MTPRFAKQKSSPRSPKLIEHHLSACRFLALLVLVNIFFAVRVNAQVVVTAGTEVIYDDNVFLEDNNGVATPIIILPADPNSGELPTTLITKQNDGHPDDSIINHPNISVSSPLPVSASIKGSEEFKLGAFIFSSVSDQNRITVDNNLNFDAGEPLIAKPFYLSVGSSLSSETPNLGVAQGTATDQVQVHDATLGLGIRGVQIAPKTDLGLGYGLTRHDFLGEWLIDSKKGEGDLKSKGSDYFSNSAALDITHHFSEKLDGSFGQKVDLLTFTNVESNDVVGLQSEDLDRIEYTTNVSTTYIANKDFTFSGGVGYVLTSYVDSTGKNVIFTVNPDGSVSPVEPRQGDTENSFIFDFAVTYAPRVGTTIGASAQQSENSGVDGGLTTQRTFQVNAAQALGDRLDLTGAGTLYQFETGGSVSNPTDRYEAAVSLKYALTPSVAVLLGYNYVDQSAKSSDGLSAFSNHDYTGNRAFIAISGGLVGISS